MLTAAIFAGVSAFKGPHWQLGKEESGAIGKALAECLDALPETQAAQSAEMMAKFSAPLALVGAVTAAVMPRVIYEQQHMARVRAEALRERQQQQQSQPQETKKNVPVPTPATDPQTGRPLANDSHLRVGAADGRATAPVGVA